MNPRMMLPVVIVTLLLGAGSAMGLSTTATATSSGHVGNYVFQYNATDSVVSNLSYVHEGTSYNLTNQIKVAGATGLNVKFWNLGSVVLDNATIVKTGSENVFLLITRGSGSNVSVAMDSNLTVTRVNLSSQMGDVNDFMDSHSSLNLGTSLSVYKADVNGTLFYVFSNVNASYSSGTAYFSSTLKPVVLGIVPFPALLQDISQGIPGQGKFMYNQTTGVAQGRYVSFGLNNSTGVIGNFQSTATSEKVFNSISVNASGKLGDGENGFLLPAGQPVVMGSLFVYSNGSYVYAFHDNPSLQSVAVWKNGTANFTLAKGLNASIINTEGSDSQISSQMATNATVFSNTALESDHNVEAGRQAVFINGTGFRGFLFVNNGNISLNGNSVLIKSNETARVTFVSPPGIDGQHFSASQKINYALRTGKIAAEIAITGANASANITVHFNNTVSMVVSNVTSGKATIKLSSADHHGANVLIFVSNSVISSNSNLKVTFDGVSVSLSSVNGVINATSSTQASFAEMQTNGGVLILLHVPHFSNHTVVISSAGSQTTSPINLSGTGGKVLLIGAIVVVIAGIAAAVSVRRKKAE